MNRMLHACLFLLIFNVSGKAISPDWSLENQPFAILADTIDPLIFCPNSQIINLAPMTCDTVVNYTINAFDDQGQVILILLDGIPSGGEFPSGTTVNTWLATDLSGNTATCSFSITTFEPLAQPLCDDLTTVLLNQNCTYSLKPFEILEGGPYGCPLHFIIEVDKTLPFGNGPWVNANFSTADINLTYQVRVTSLLTNAKCYGNVVVRDSVPPIVSCQTINVPCALPLEQLTPAFLRDSFGISFAMPVVTDACGGSMFATSFVDVSQNLPCDDTTTVSGIIHRVWSATDLQGNTGTCEQLIRRQRILANVQIPANKTHSCTNSDISESTNGLPYIQFLTRRYEITPASYCEFDWNFVDTFVVGDCAGEFTVKRTWRIYDACLPFSATNPKIGVQNIVIEDNSGPVIQCPNDLIITAIDNNCRASVDLPDVFLSDNCSALMSFQAFWSDNSLSQSLLGTIEDDTLGIVGVVASFPIGTTNMLYTAEDECGNIGECSFNLTVANMVAPTVKCDSLLVVGLPANGFLKMPAIILDNGSTDDCSPLFFKAKLTETNVCHTESLLSDTIHICCKNLGDTLVGTLRVFDIAVPLGTITNNFGAGHYTDCTFKIRVSGTNPPFCTAPPNITVSCEAFDPTLVSYGGVLAQSCSVDSIAMTLNLSLFDTICSRGTLTRNFKAFTANGQMAQCSQKITVTYTQQYAVRFPDDVLVTTCDTSGNYGAPTFFGNDCELTLTSYEDQVFTIVPDACLKIERTWKVINWCTYEPNLPVVTVPNPNPNVVNNHPDNLLGPVVSYITTNGDPWKSSLVKISSADQFPTNFATYYSPNVNGYYYTQIIKIIDIQDPVVEACSSDTKLVQDITNNDPQLWNAAYWFDPVHVSSDMCEGPSDISITASDACAGGAVSIEYQLILDLDGDGVRETNVNSTAFPPSNTVFYNNASGVGQARQFDFRPLPANQKWGFALQETITGNKKTATVRFNTSIAPNAYSPAQLPHGTHKIRWFVSDACGNETVCEYLFTVKDTKAPTVLCDNSLAINLFGLSGTATLWASDILLYTEDNCTPNDYLQLSVRREGSGAGFPLDANGNPIVSLGFDCFDLGTQTVELWSRDKAGNAGSCTATVMISNNNGANCGDVFGNSLSGYIKTELNEAVDGVTVNISGTSSNTPPIAFSLIDLTDTLGFYGFPSVVPFAATLTITPELNTNPLNGLTTFDLLLISKHILGIQPLGSPYKMIAADANKSKSITSFDIVEFRKLILGIYVALPNNDSWRFIPKDSLFSNPANPFQSAFPEAIAVPNLFNHLSDANFVGVKIGDVNNTVEANANTSVEERSAGILHFEVSANGHDVVQSGEFFEVSFKSEAALLGCQFTLNFNGLDVLEILPGANVEREHFGLFPEKNALTMAWEKGGVATFTLKCQAKEAGNLREMLRLNSRITKAEGYQLDTRAQAQRFDLALHFPDMNTFELFQNHPNPFAGATDISFNLPDNSEATLKVFDVNGRMLFTQTAQYERGTHTITLDKSALDAVGVLYYQLETAQHSATRKMIKI